MSNSDLTALKLRLYPQLDFVKPADRERAFRLGTLVDAYVTEPSKIDFYKRTVDGEPYTDEEFRWGESMKDALEERAVTDGFLRYVLENAETQRFLVNERQAFEYGCFEFELATRCKWDWNFPDEGFGGDLKTVSATSQAQFENCIDYFDWDRSRAWYMDIAHSLNPAWGNMDFIYGISKKNFKVFFKKIERGDAVYESGKEKYLDLAFKYWYFQ